MNQLFGEKNLHRAFEVGLLFKAIFAALEALGGLIAFFISQNFLLRLIVRLTQQDRVANPDNAVASYLLHWAQNFSISTRHFVGAYLLTHGVIKLMALVGLWRGKSWSYPVAMAVFAIFVVYQLYRFSFTHSPWLLLLSFFDLVVLWLIWKEYQIQRRAPAPHASAAARRPS
jgi:uncharacterized membrane protein